MEPSGAISRVITGVRNIRGELNVSPSERLSAMVVCPEKRVRRVLAEHSEYIISQARLSGLEIVEAGDRPPQSAVFVMEEIEIYLRLGGILNFQEEMKRLDKAEKKVGAELEKIGKKLSNPQFMEKAPKEIVAKEEERLKALREEQEKIGQHQEQLREIAACQTES